MYEYISGLVAELAPTYAVVDVAGVGYYINISLQTYAAIEGEKSARLYVHFIVREDAQQLYGFATKLERELFRNLISVSGVGGNTARMILSTYSTSELRNIIATENAVLLKNVKGLGLKTAQKIIVELSGKMLELGADKEAVVPTAANGGTRYAWFPEDGIGEGCEGAAEGVADDFGRGGGASGIAQIVTRRSLAG